MIALAFPCGEGGSVTAADGYMIGCSCCSRTVWLGTTLMIGTVVFCRDCRPADDVLEDWDQRMALIMALVRDDSPPCPHTMRSRVQPG